MKPTTFEQGFDLVVTKLREIMIRKQRQYGHGNIMDFGKTGVMIRLNDKMNRIKNLYNTNHKPEDESVVDSYIDICNYGIIWLMLHENVFHLPLTENKGGENK